MQTERKERKMMKTLRTNVFAMVVTGLLVTCAYTGGCANDKPSSTDPLAVVMASSPSPSARTTDRVASWKFYNKDKQSIQVLGLDSDGKVVAELLLSVDTDDNDEVQKITVETVSPERSSVWFKPDKDGEAAIEKSTDKAVESQHVFDNLEKDIQAYSASGSKGQSTRGFWDCAAATLAMVGACGATAATCVETAGLGCALGGAGCVASVHTYLKEC
jgi:hypothetical protein